MNVLDKELLDILACPVCKGDLTYEADKDILVCERCGVYYEIKDGIPVLLSDSGRPLGEEKT